MSRYSYNGRRETGTGMGMEREETGREYRGFSRIGNPNGRSMGERAGLQFRNS